MFPRVGGTVLVENHRFPIKGHPWKPSIGAAQSLGSGFRWSRFDSWLHTGHCVTLGRSLNLAEPQVLCVMDSGAYLPPRTVGRGSEMRHGIGSVLLLGTG